MKQKELNEKQRDLLTKLSSVLSELEEAGIGLIYDDADGTLTAFNNEDGAWINYDEGEPMDWDKTDVLPGYYYSFSSNFDKVYLEFH